MRSDWAQIFVLNSHLSKYLSVLATHTANWKIIKIASLTASCWACKLILGGQFCCQITEHMAYAIFISLVVTWYLAYLNKLKSHNDVLVLRCFSVPSFLSFIFHIIYSCVISFFDLTGITKHPSGSAIVKYTHRKQNRSHQFSLLFFFFSFLFSSSLLKHSLLLQRADMIGLSRLSKIDISLTKGGGMLAFPWWLNLGNLWGKN